jgi:hypothetical protein
MGPPITVYVSAACISGIREGPVMEFKLYSVTSFSGPHEKSSVYPARSQAAYKHAMLFR